MNSERSLLICEEALKDFNGHWFEYNKAVVEIHKKSGVRTELLAHKDAEDAVIEELDVKPYFPWTNWDQIYNHPKAWRRYLGILTHNWRVFRYVSKHLKTSETYDLVFVPTVVIYHLIAWLLIAQFYRHKAKKIVLLIRNSSAEYLTDDGKPTYSRSAKVTAIILSRFRRFIDKNAVAIVSDSHRLAKEYENLANVKVGVVPHPCLLNFCSQKNLSRKNHDRLVISLLGPARWEKGVGVLLKAFSFLKDFPIPNLKLVLQWPNEVYQPDGVLFEPDLKEFNESKIQLELIDKSLTSDEYMALLHETDIMALPYLRSSYYARISGIAVETMLCGIPIIYTKDTWNSDMVQNYGSGTGFKSEDSKDLAKAIFHVISNIEEFKSSAADRSKLAKGFFSSDQFLNKLWQS